jgi:hypothetical protein
MHSILQENTVGTLSSGGFQGYHWHPPPSAPRQALAKNKKQAHKVWQKFIDAAAAKPGYRD